MSGFLKKFNKEEYQKVNHKINFSDEAFTESQTESKKTVTPIKTAVPFNEAKTSNDNTFVTSNTREEMLFRDDDRIKKRRITIGIVVICLLFLSYGGYLLYQQVNKVNVPTFVNEKNISDVEVWAAKNKIELDSTSKYSISCDEGIILKQSEKGGSSIQKGSSFKVIVSKGANLEARIKLVDFSKMKLVDIEKWKEKNKASNVLINKVYSDDIASGSFISMVFNSEGIDANSYRRKDKLTITVSKGKEVFEKDIVVLDFKNKSKSEVDTWASEKGVKVEYSYEASNSIMQDSVISQSISPKTKIAKNEIIKIVLSKGKVAFVPNFFGLDETLANIEAAKSNVTISVSKYYNSQVSAGQLISQSIAANSEVSTETVILVYSAGKPFIANFDEQSYFALVQSINEMNAQGAQLSYEVQEVDSSLPKGQIITTSAKAEFVDVGAKVIISVSKGNK